MDWPSPPLANGPLTRSADATVATAQPASWLHRALIFPIKLLWGMIFCQGVLGSLFVVGWTYRLAQRSALKFWFSRSAQPQTAAGFAAFLAGDPATHSHLDWPNWFLHQDFQHFIPDRSTAGPIVRLVSFVGGLVHSLGRNFWTGLGAILCMWALTLPAGVLWWFGWYDGWNNSFNKGYEQAAVGPLISVLGILWFVAVMFYVPLAQARQAVTGEWRSFFDFRLVWRLARANRLACTGLALLYCVLAVPLNILKATPMFWPQMNSALGELSPAQALSTLNHYFFWSALAVFPFYVALRLVAARIYAGAILRAVQLGQTPVCELRPLERQILERLGLTELRPKPRRSELVRFIAWSGTRVGSLVAGVVLGLLSFVFAAENYISEFVCYHGALGWLNQPLVQLPWFHYVPASLKSPSDNVFLLLLFWLVALLLGSIGKAITGPRGRRFE